MRITADSHVHVYPFHDAAEALRALRGNLAALAPDALCVGMLTERHDCRFFRDLREGKVGLDGWRVTALSDDAVSVRISGSGEIVLVAGRQIVCEERIEILALTHDGRWPDGQTAERTVRAVQDAGAVPVLAWAPGKWFGGRGWVVRRLLEQGSPGSVLIGDSTMRPIGWGEPRLVRWARARGFRILAGSDPLPIRGEERRLGTYASVFDGPFDTARPALSLRSLLTAPETTVLSVGRRSGPAQWALRMLRNTIVR